MRRSRPYNVQLLLCKESRPATRLLPQHGGPGGAMEVGPFLPPARKSEQTTQWYQNCRTWKRGPTVARGSRTLATTALAQPDIVWQRHCPNRLSCGLLLLVSLKNTCLNQQNTANFGPDKHCERHKQPSTIASTHQHIGGSYRGLLTANNWAVLRAPATS